MSYILFRKNIKNEKYEMEKPNKMILFPYPLIWASFYGLVSTFISLQSSYILEVVIVSPPLKASHRNWIPQNSILNLMIKDSRIHGSYPGFASVGNPFSFHQIGHHIEFPPFHFHSLKV